MKLENNVLIIDNKEYPRLQDFTNDIDISIEGREQELFHIIAQYADQHATQRVFEDMEEFTLLTWKDFADIPAGERHACIESFIQQKGVIKTIATSAKTMFEMIHGAPPKDNNDLNLNVFLETIQLKYVHDHQNKHTLNINI